MIQREKGRPEDLPAQYKRCAMRALPETPYIIRQASTRKKKKKKPAEKH
jgi:hypothetical protein